MSTRVIVLVLAFAAAAAVGGAAFRFGPELLLSDGDSRDRVGAEAEAIPAPAAQPAVRVEELEEEPEIAGASPPADGGDDATELVPPSFDIIRVEPTGELLAAGRAAPGATVDLLLGEEPLVSDDSNIDGEWAVIPVTPLPVGEHEIALRATGANGEGGPIEGDRATVIISSSGASPVIAIARPDETAQVIQQPEEVAAAGEAPQPAEPDAVADNAAVRTAEDSAAMRDELAEATEPAAGPESQPPPEQSPDPADAAEVAATPSHEVALAGASPHERDAIVEQTEARRKDERESDWQIAPAPDLPEREAVASAAQDEAVIDAGPSAPDWGPEQEVVQGEREPEDPSARHEAEEPTSKLALRPATGDEESDLPPSRDEPQDPETLAALPAADEASDAASGQSAAPALDIRTVEVTEIGEAQFTGRAEPGSIVRLYVNDQELDEAVAGETGAWSASGEIELPPGRYLARADVIDGDGEVRASARLRFDRVRIEAAEAGAERAQPAVGREAPAAAASEHVVETPAEASRAAEAAGRTSAAADVAGVEAADRPVGGGPEVAPSRPQAPTDGHAADGATIETRVVVAPVAGLSEGPEAVYIQRGDNLWRIARSIYGRGIQYERIYEANRNQIRNPHLIFPGQVFTIPLPDEESD